jgi:hypothetical protein
MNPRKATIPLALALLAAVPLPRGGAQWPTDYRARTIYFLVVDRFHAHAPYHPYVDPQYPDATTSPQCSC